MDPGSIVGWIISGVVGIVVAIIIFGRAAKDAEETKQALITMERNQKSRWVVSTIFGLVTTVAVEFVRVKYFGGASVLSALM